MTSLLHILQHALGRDQYGRGTDYRNHYVAGGDDLATCRDAAAQGLMVEHAAREISGGDPIFTVTAAGKTYIAEHSPKPPKVPRSKARYLRWLHESDATQETFGEFLRRGAP